MQPRTKFSGCSTCRILSHLCICNIFVRSHFLCPKWAAVPWQTGAKSKVSFFIAMAQTPIEVDLTNDTPPHWTTQGATTPPAATTAAAEPPTCAICLQDIHRGAMGPNAPYDWPACSHPIHLRCAMQHVSHQAQSTCPSADNNGHKTANTDWNNSGKQTKFHGWYLKPPTTPRTFTPNHHPPPTSLSSCVAPGWHSSITTTQSWTHLGGNSQQDTWNGPSLSTAPAMSGNPSGFLSGATPAVTPNDLSMDINVPPPICPFHGPRRLAIDLRHNERGWVCSRGLPPHILECEPTRINPSAPPSTPAAPGQRQWEHQRPPRGRTSYTPRKLLVLRSITSCRGKPSYTQQQLTRGGITGMPGPNGKTW